MSLEEVVVSAPGKVILHGEHAVVYGKTAIAASLNLRSYLRLIPGHDERVTVNFPSINVCKAWTVRELAPILAVFKVDIQQPERPSEERVKSINKFIENDQESTSPLDSALVAFLYLYTSLCQKTSPPPSLSIKLVSDLPVGAGLGSSASFSVCLATALLLHQQYIKAPIDGEWTANDLGMINMWAFQGERIIHGNPSGIDNSVSTYGGALKFQSGQITKLDRIPNLKILLTSTKVPRSTKVLVGKVKDRSEKYPGVLTPVMEAIEAVSERCQEIYKEMTTAPGGDDSSHYTTLEELIDINQHLLQVLGVSHVTLDKICHVTSKYRLHSKLTGAGGGGCAFTLLSPSIDSNSVEKVKKELEPDGFSCWETDIGGAGVTVHNKVPQCLL